MFQTGADARLGTPRYMAPEQLEGKDPSPASDQWALGTTAYELLSHRHSGGALAGRPAPLDTIVPELPLELAIVVARMIEREPAERYPSMDVVATELAACLPLLEPKAVEDGPDTDRADERPRSTAAAPRTVEPLERTVPLAPALRLPQPDASPLAGGTVRLRKAVAANALARAVPPSQPNLPEPRPSAPSLDSGSGIRVAHAPHEGGRGFVVLAVVVVVLTLLAGAAGAWIMR